MRSTIILTTLFTATVLASPHPKVDVIQVRQVERRQDASSIDLSTLIPSACILPSSLQAVPTAPSAVLSALATWTNPCEIPSITGSAGAEYTSYTSALSSWAKANSAKLESWESVYKTACPFAATLSAGSALSVPTVLPTNTALMSLASCGATTKAGGHATAASKSGGDAATSASGSAASAATASASGSSAVSTGAAAQQTAFAAVAGMLAGFVGVVAAL
ncbi:hypothetical protein BU16DRAFT_532215 [Lophium mytilinum]|uniref:Infection structure specific protein n=1 Tax=Lophium mytilinum TaxID=390894 RepID=A0A6A6Q9Y8_9PEZI|nr:hypothetical protein BU16DRAFT_532215 [Lophium mytilinum]